MKEERSMEANAPAPTSERQVRAAPRLLAPPLEDREDRERHEAPPSEADGDNVYEEQTSEW